MDSKDLFLSERDSLSKDFRYSYLMKKYEPVADRKMQLPDVGLPDEWEQRLHSDKLEELVPDEIKAVVTEISEASRAHPRAVTAYVLSAASHVVSAVYDAQRAGFPVTSASDFTVVIEETGNAKSLSIEYATYTHNKFNRRNAGGGDDVSGKALYRTWELRIKAHEKSLAKLDDDPAAIENWTAKYEELLSSKPVKARKAKSFVMNDITWSKITKSLSEASPVAGIIHDDASGMLKKLVMWSAELCAVWSGRDINHERTTTGSHHQASPRLSMLLAVQPIYWDPFVKEHGDRLIQGGLAPRMNIVRIPTGSIVQSEGDVQ